jgi:drug/metabolite transporter (DMT)-like permease
MALVTIAALWMALLLICFKVFGKREVPLLPAIVINYFTACAWGVGITKPWTVGLPGDLIAPALFLGVLFITLFYLTAQSAQRAGVAATSVASKMSLVLTVLFAVAFLDERPEPLGWAGICLAIIAVPAASYAPGAPGARGVWLLPALLFVGNAAIDITINTVQRELLTPGTEPLFPTLVFAVAGALGIIALGVRGDFRSLLQPKAIIGGLVLGSMNYASLYFLVAALSRSGMPSSSVFPLLNIGVILFSTALGIVLFEDKPRRMQVAGIALAVIAMGLILAA